MKFGVEQRKLHFLNSEKISVTVKVEVIRSANDNKRIRHHTCIDIDFFTSVFDLFGSGGVLVVAVVVFLVGLGIYKFLKDWLPW
jgi:hypothetical protein